MMAEELVRELIYPTPPKEPEEPMDPDSAMALSIQVQQDFWVDDRFRPTGQHDLAPSGAIAKTEANLAALRALRQLQSEGRAATAPEQATLARWASWGAVPEVFDEANPRFASTRAELHTLLSEKEWAAARRTTINAHYTSAEVVQAVWSAVADLGFVGGRVLEPGCGSGNFIGFAPARLCDHRSRA